MGSPEPMRFWGGGGGCGGRVRGKSGDGVSLGGGIFSPGGAGKFPRGKRAVCPWEKKCPFFGAVFSVSSLFLPDFSPFSPKRTEGERVGEKREKRRIFDGKSTKTAKTAKILIENRPLAFPPFRRYAGNTRKPRPHFPSIPAQSSIPSGSAPSGPGNRPAKPGAAPAGQAAAWQGRGAGREDAGAERKGGTRTGREGWP